MENYIVKPAMFPFTCPIYGERVKKGENCVEYEGGLFCMKLLEEKNLTPVKSRSLASTLHPSTPLGKRAQTSIEFQNLLMRHELLMIAENPEGNAAKKIIARYRRILMAGKEVRLTREN
jgi:hypothetical protein